MNDIGLPSGTRIAARPIHKQPHDDYQHSWRLLICLLAPSQSSALWTALLSSRCGLCCRQAPFGNHGLQSGRWQPSGHSGRLHYAIVQKVPVAGLLAALIAISWVSYKLMSMSVTNPKQFRDMLRLFPNVIKTWMQIMTSLFSGIHDATAAGAIAGVDSGR